MRPVPTLVAALVLGLGAGAAAGQSPAGRQLVSCQKDITKASARYVARRRQALKRCLAKAMRCPAALAGSATAGDDPCLAAVAQRCLKPIPGVERAGGRLETTGPSCVAPAPGRGVPIASFFDYEGLGFEGVGAFCPGTPMTEDNPADASHCQRVALACSADGAVATAAPRTRELLERLGVPVAATCYSGGLCGNGVLDGDEECDDGAGNSDTAADACRTTCEEYYCGDGALDSDEECDDGNFDDTDGCDSDCLVSDGSCGDGVVDPAEECDDGRQNSDLLPDHCRTDCSLPYCDDGVVDPLAGEECEPPGSLLCDDDCLLRLPLGGLAAPALAADDVGRCQHALLDAGAHLFERTRKRMTACVTGLERCLLAFTEDVDPNGDALDACLSRATSACNAAVAARADLLARAVTRAEAGCRAVPLDRLLDGASGLGFAALAAECPAPEGAPAPADLFACVFGAVQCRADNAVARTVPLAYDLLWELDLDPDEDLPCVTPAEVE